MDSCKEMKDLYQELADSSRELADSYKSLKTIAADLLSSWERFKVQQAAATSSPSTITTTPPPTAPLPAPATPGTDAPTNIESATDSPLQFSVVPELARPAPATCSTKRRDVLPKQCEVTSAVLADTYVVQKAAVLPASCSATTSSFRSVDSTAAVPIPEAGVLVAAICVPPRPPDLHVLAPEDYDATKVMEASLLGEDACMPVPEHEKALLASVILKPMIGNVHQKEQDKERPMPWPSFVCYWLSKSSLKPRQTPQGSCLQCLFNGRQKMAMIPCIQSVAVWAAYFSGQQLQQMCPGKVGFVRKILVADFWAQPTSASTWKSAFQFCWKLQAGITTPCHCIQWIDKKHYSIMPGIGKNTSCKQYGTYQAALARTYVTIVVVLPSINLSLCWMPKAESHMCAKVSVQLIRQSGDVSRVRPNLRRSFVHELLCIDWQELQLTRDQINVSLLIVPAPEANDVNGLELSIHSSEFNSLSTCTDTHLHGSATVICPRAISKNCQQHLLIISFNISWFSCHEILQFGQLQVAMAAFPLITECSQHVFSYTGGPVDHHPWPPCLQYVGILLDKNLHAPWGPGIQLAISCFVAMSKEVISCGNAELFYQTKLQCFWKQYTSMHITGDSTAPWVLLLYTVNREDVLSMSIICNPGDVDQDILLTSSVVYRTKFETVNLEWQSARSFHLGSLMPHLPYRLSHFASGEVSTFLLHALTWSMAAVHIYLHDYTLFQWNCLLEHEAMPARKDFWCLKLAIQRVFSEVSSEPYDLGVHQFFHWAMSRQEADLALPWDPGGNFPTAWGQAEFQAGEYVMY